MANSQNFIIPPVAKCQSLSQKSYTPSRKCEILARKESGYVLHNVKTDSLILILGEVKLSQSGEGDGEEGENEV